jgi:hypothetical protein
VIITDSLSTIMAAESHTSTKNPKTQTNRKMLDQEGPRITLLCVPSHKGISGNEKADQAAKEAMDEDIPSTERYPPDDLKKWLSEEDFKKRDQRWKNENNEMKERKPNVETEVQIMNMDMIKEQWINAKKGMDKTIDYATGKKNNHSKEEENHPR